MELLDNSIRAQLRNGSNKDITVKFQAKNTGLSIIITDFGGGIHSKAPNNFGMGLPAARKVFPIFIIRYHDGQGHNLPQGEPSIAGTSIEMEIYWKPNFTTVTTEIKPISFLEISLSA